MSKKLIIMAVLAGLMAGHLFARDQRSISVINNLQFGYSDNLYRNTNNEESFFVKDVINVAFRAAFSARTDFMAKSRFELLDDAEGAEFYPNIYAMLNHSFSPRLLLRVTDYHRSSERSGAVGSLGNDVRYNYFYNRAGASANYVLNAKNRLELSGGYSVKQYDDEAAELLDTTVADVGFGWSKEIAPQRTRSTLQAGYRWIDYDNREASLDMTDLSALLGHTFNQEVHGTLQGGITYVTRDFPAMVSSDSSVHPLVNAGLVYSPSPQTRFNADVGYSFGESDDTSYAGQTTAELRLGAQHDITAKLMGRVTARFANNDFDSEDRDAGGSQDSEEDRMTLEVKLAYRLNRINFLELSVKHTRKERDPGTNWDENRIQLGWRVELN